MDMSTEQQSLVVSITAIGCVSGVLISGPLSDWIGRKVVIMIADIFFTAGSLLMCFAPTI